MLIIRRLNCIEAASGIVLSVSGHPVHRLKENAFSFNLCSRCCINTIHPLSFILYFSPSSHKYDIGHIKLSLHSPHYIKTSIHSIYNKGTYNKFTSLVELSNIEYNSNHTLIYIYIFFYLGSCLVKE